ncbi:MAG: OmpA family protein [Myxococcales bacterium]|nr:MAG: OmpA family protein [Myxococcales bacterium]
MLVHGGLLGSFLGTLASFRATLLFVAAFVLVFSAGTMGAEAQRLGGQRFEPADSPDGVLGTRGADERPELDPYLALWANYMLNPVVIRDAADNEQSVLEHTLAFDLVASMTLWKGLQFGLAMPVGLLRTDEPGAAVAAGLANQTGAALGDLRLHLAYRFQLGYFSALAIYLPIMLPTSSNDDTLAFGFGVKPTLAFSQHIGALQILINASFLYRKDVDVLDYTAGSELGGRFALRYALGSEGHTGLLAEVGMNTATRDFLGAGVTPLEVRGGVEQQFAENWRMTGFAGSALSTGVGSPDIRIGLGIAYAPEQTRPRKSPEDRDGDGIRNEDDKCPDEAEDEDGFQDWDGCPDLDNDQDGFLDGDDECPMAPESKNGFLDEDGCPDYVKLEGGRIVTFQPVYFTSNSDNVQERSRDMMDEIANIMKANPEMTMRVEGHADSVGRADHNLKLSQKRADTVKRYLVEEGDIDASRIQSKGYGERKPIASNQTQQGRAENRRVEFHVRWGKR